MSRADYMGLAWSETKHSRYKYGKIETNGSMLEAIETMKLVPALGAAYVADRIEEMRKKEARHYNNTKEKVVKPHAKMLGIVTTGQTLAPLTTASAPAITSGVKAITATAAKLAGSATEKVTLTAAKNPELIPAVSDITGILSHNSSSPMTPVGSFFNTFYNYKDFKDGIGEVAKIFKKIKK